MSFGIDDVRAAARRIEGRVARTPLLESRTLNEAAGARVFLKAENLQRGGAFKCRGAFNKVLTLPAEPRVAGLVADSSGNHAVALAMVAADLGLPAVVVMPADAPELKIRACRSHGAELIFFDRATQDRRAIVDRLVAERAWTFIPPYDDYAVMAGAGTSALEAAEQLPPGVRIDAALAGCSGGGLISGWCAVAAALIPGAGLYAVEPEGFDDTGRSLRKGQRVSNERLAGSVCDSLLAPTPGELTFGVMARAGVRPVTVSDREVIDAVRFAFEHLKLVVEPGGAAALAAVLGRKFSPDAKAVLAVLSGGNMDAQAFGRHVAPADRAHTPFTPP